MARRQRRLKAQTRGTKVNRLAVFDRDGWKCHLCDQPIDPGLSGRDKMGPTLDHVVPLVRGGAHSMENVRAAHRSCNSRKGSR